MLSVSENHVFIGIGGTGGKVLKAIRKRLFQETTEEERGKLPLGFIYVDSSMEMMNPKDTTWKVLGDNSQLGKDSFLYIRSAELSALLAGVAGYPGIKGWIGKKKIWDNIVGNVGDDGAAAQKRRLGRFLFACSVNEYEAILKNQVQRVKEISGNTDVTFHVFAGLAGGTGSGSVVDLVAQTRKHFVPNPTSGLNYKIILYCQIPEQSPLPNWDKGAYHANGFAALTELNAFKVRQFIPSDVSGQFDKVPYDGNDFFNSCFLYTNANESGTTVNTEKDLPNIVKDFVYHYITLPEDSNVREFKDCFSTENVDPKDEYDENAVDTDLKIPVRSKAFKAFGIKRIVNPEEEIKEYLTYNFALQSLYRIRFNNWSDELGYRDEALPEDYRSMVFDNKQFLKSVCLTDDHLMLSQPVLESEKELHWKTFVDDWEAIMPIIGDSSWNNNPDNALQEMARLCQDRFEKKFRNNGVSNFFSVKLKSKNEHAKQIATLIEKNLFEQWKSGERSLYGISRLVATISEYVDESSKRLQKRIIDSETKLNDLLDRKTRDEQEWGKVGFFGKHLLGSRKDLHANHIPLMKKIYILKTELEGLHFAKALIMDLSMEVSSLSDSINEMNERFNTAIKETRNNVNIRCVEENAEDNYQNAVVRYYDPALVRSVTKVLCLSKQYQNDQSKSVIMSIANECGAEYSFNKLEEKVSKDVIVSILEKSCREAATIAHNDFVQSNGKKGILGKNVIDQLYEKYGSSEQSDELKAFADKMMRSAGVFLTFDSAETTRHINNNVAPRPGVNIMFRSTLVSIPAVADKNKETFVNKLVDAFRSGTDGTKKVSFELNSTKKNEITIMNLTYCFPLRTVNDLKILKQKYDLMVNDPQQGEINRLVLHLEGDGTQYPPLFVEKFKPDNYLKEMLLGVAMGLISYQEINDGTGIKYYAQLKVDDMGFALPPVVYCKKLSELHECEDVNKADILTLKDDIDAKMQNEYLHVTAKAELSKKVVELANIVLGERKNNISDPVYKKYLDVCKALATELRSN